DIYAKWTESATRAQAVTYTVQHAGGATEIMVNQQQPSAGWFRLGAFAMSPGQNHHVEVAGALEGVTVADAMRFVSAGTSAPGINYVHTDHLGTPQKMTDATKAIVWDAVYTPFGQVHSITGTATNNQRFPSQYAYAETGYSYNYFRDYEPTTGRYVQSDPIGLRGGLNTYGYVYGNPLRFFDPWGLITVCRYPGFPPHIGAGAYSSDTYGKRTKGTSFFGKIALGKDVPGEVSKDPGEKQCVDLGTNPEDNQKFQEYLDKEIADKDPYNVFEQSCVDFVRDGLREVLGMELSDTNFPRTLFDEIVIQSAPR
ncbi:MAG: RHS repeat-associated core domain-containing protein, partial [Nitrospirales bacterium]